MSSLKFYQTIDKSFIGKFIDKEANLWDKLDPEYIDVENIRSFYGMPLFAAKFFCKMAVRMNIFKERFQVICPNEERSIYSFDSKKEIPNEIYCTNCEANEETKFRWSKDECEIKTVYKLVK